MVCEAAVDGKTRCGFRGFVCAETFSAQAVSLAWGNVHTNRVLPAATLVGLARINRPALCTFATVPGVADTIVNTRPSVVTQGICVAAAEVGGCEAVVDCKACNSVPSESFVAATCERCRTRWRALGILRITIVHVFLAGIDGSTNLATSGVSRRASARVLTRTRFEAHSFIGTATILDVTVVAFDASFPIPVVAFETNARVNARGTVGAVGMNAATMH